jgi:alpha-L-fucosidase
MFIHYGLFAFSGLFHGIRWGREGENPLYTPSLTPVDPRLFNPSELDASQWVEGAKSSGLKYLIFTAKHHDGFCLWPTATSDYSVKASSWRGGQGDVVKEVADACHAQGIGFGLYLSPWDAYAWEVLKLNDVAYDRFYIQQWTELLTHYGPLMEVWWDGAGADLRQHDWMAYYRSSKSLQPDALVALSGPAEIRWVTENSPETWEGGLAPDPLWNLVHISEDPKEPSPTGGPWPHELRGKDFWVCPEAYTAIDTFWSGGTLLPFNHKQDTVKSVEQLANIYHASVGHGANLVINFVPNQCGLLDERQLGRLRELDRIIRRTYGSDLVSGHTITASSASDEDHRPDRATDHDPHTWWQAAEGVTSAWLEVDLGRPVTFDRVVLQEAISCGQRVRRYQLLWWDGIFWQQASAGTSIGHKKIDVFPRITSRRVRLHITAATAAPTLRHFGLYLAS